MAAANFDLSDWQAISCSNECDTSFIKNLLGIELDCDGDELFFI